MKKIFKRVLALVLAAALLCGLCGCSALDEMRKNQAYYDDAGNIVWNGATYKLLTYSGPLFPEIDYNAQIVVTEDDVPVLLSIFLAQMWLSPSTDGKFLEDQSWNYYCREDAYDEIVQRLQEEFVPEVVCYFYDIYNEDTWNWEEKSYTLTQDQIAAIELVISTVEPVSYNATGMYPEYIYSLDIIECSADMLLQACSTALLVGNDRYYLELYTDTDTLIFTVPEGCNEIFGQIVSAYESRLIDGDPASEYYA